MSEKTKSRLSHKSLGNEERKRLAQQIAAEIQLKLNTAERKTFYRKNDEYSHPIANDYGLKESYTEALSKLEKGSHRLKVALIVGSGAILSYLPEFADAGIDLIINIDFAPKTFRVLSKEEELLFGQNVTRFQLEDFIDLGLVDMEGVHASHNYTQRMQPFFEGDRHYASSQQRFNEVSVARKKITRCSALVDIQVPEDIRQLSSILTSFGAEISLINISNVSPMYVKPKPLINSLCLLPLGSDYHIIYSNSQLFTPVSAAAVSMPPLKIDSLESQLLEEHDTTPVSQRMNFLNTKYEEEIRIWKQSSF